MFGTQTLNKKELIKVLEDNAKVHEKAVADATKKTVEILQSEVCAFAEDHNARTVEIPSRHKNDRMIKSLRDKIAVLKLLAADTVTLTDAHAGEALSALINATEPKADTNEVTIHCD